MPQSRDHTNDHYVARLTGQETPRHPRQLVVHELERRRYNSEFIRRFNEAYSAITSESDAKVARAALLRTFKSYPFGLYPQKDAESIWNAVFETCKGFATKKSFGFNTVAVVYEDGKTTHRIELDFRGDRHQYKRFARWIAEPDATLAKIDKPKIVKIATPL